MRLSKQRLPDTLTVVWDHSTLLVLTLLDPTRDLKHPSSDLVPLVASPHVVLSLGSSLSSADIGGKPAMRLSKQRLPDTLTVVWDHSSLLVLTLLAPTRDLKHPSSDLVPLVASPHVGLSLGSSQL